MGLVSLSTGWLPRLEERPYYELSTVLKVMKRFSQERHVDGFEFGLLPEWDCENPPLTPAQGLPDCEKHGLDEILAKLLREDFRILSVHASRDVGCYLCSEEEQKFAKGLRLLEDSLRFCRSLKVNLCVVHFWDPWKKSFDVARLRRVHEEFQNKFPDVAISVENIPTVIDGRTPFSLMHGLRHVTLDLKWASMFNEFDLFLDRLDAVDNVHIQGKSRLGSFYPTVGNLDYERALLQLAGMGYSRLFTVELDGKATFQEILSYAEKLKNIEN
jgi:sugar phosphate isomerase/epimerase